MPIPSWLMLMPRRSLPRQGEAAALLNSLDAVSECFTKPEGCVVVPGLTDDQYYFSLVISVSAGVVAGAVGRLEPSGEAASTILGLCVVQILGCECLGSQTASRVCDFEDDVDLSIHREIQSKQLPCSGRVSNPRLCHRCLLS